MEYHVLFISLSYSAGLTDLRGRPDLLRSGKKNIGVLLIKISFAFFCGTFAGKR